MNSTPNARRGMFAHTALLKRVQTLFNPTLKQALNQERQALQGPWQALEAFQKNPRHLLDQEEECVALLTSFLNWMKEYYHCLSIQSEELNQCTEFGLIQLSHLKHNQWTLNVNQQNYVLPGFIGHAMRCWAWDKLHHHEPTPDTYVHQLKQDFGRLAQWLLNPMPDSRGSDLSTWDMQWSVARHDILTNPTRILKNYDYLYSPSRLFSFETNDPSHLIFDNFSDASFSQPKGLAHYLKQSIGGSSNTPTQFGWKREVVKRRIRL